MDLLRVLADPVLVAKFQRFCGVEAVKPCTCDQQTQTKRQNSNNVEQETHEENVPSKPPSEPSNNRVYTVKDQVRQRNVKKEFNNNNKINTHGAQEHFNKLDYISNNMERSQFTSRSSPLHCCEDAVNIHTTQQFIPESDSDVQQERKRLKPVANIRWNSLYYLAKFGAFLGNEEFYLTFFPFCVWNVDFLIVRQVGLLWGMVMYLGQATKDYLRWPRPQCPPVVRLETFYLQEFSMPSTHAMAGTAIPMFLAQMAVVRYEVPLPIAVAVAVTWFTVTCFSRLYLGVHSVLDLLVGMIYAVLLYLTFIRYVEGYDVYQQTHPFAPIMIMTTALVLCTVCYPSRFKNSSKGDAVQIVSAVAGCSFGAWLGYQFGYMHEPLLLKPYSVEVPTLTWLYMTLLRFGTGLVILGISYLALGKLMVQLFSYLYGLDVPDKSNPSVMTAYKFTTYFCLGVIICFVIPLIHLWLGIERPMFFTEVL